MESPRSLREKVEGMGVGQEGMATSTEQEATTPRPTVVEGDAKRGKGSWRVGGGGMEEKSGAGCQSSRCSPCRGVCLTEHNCQDLWLHGR